MDNIRFINILKHSFLHDLLIIRQQERDDKMNEILKIIIADDNLALVDFMKASIEKDTRFKVVGIATNDKEEIDLIEREKPNIVITDLKRNNEYTGIDIIERYNNKEYKPIFFIISAMAMYYIEDIRRLDIRYYLNKPFDNDRLLDKMNDIYEEVYPKSCLVARTGNSSLKSKCK